MLVGSILKNLLWVLGYPAFPSKLEGPYQTVGAIQTRIPGSVSCQVHYPCNPTKKSDWPYFRPQAVEGVADYSGNSASLLGFLSKKKHPCYIGAEPIESEDGFPLIVFSHGLGGCMEMYTQFCQQLASHGYCVVALEHEDGSGAFAETNLGERIYYKRPDDTPYSREKVLKFREPFLEQRVQETTNALTYILESSSSDDSELTRVLQSTNKNKVLLLGHSFGGSSMILATREYLSSGSIKPTWLGVLDPWAFSVPDNVLQDGISSIPLCCILSESWLTNPETEQIKELLQNSKTVTSLHVPKSVHASFADSVSWLPGFILRRLQMRGEKEKRHETIQVTANACLQSIQNKDIFDGLEPWLFGKGQIPTAPSVSPKEEPVDSY